MIVEWFYVHNAKTIMVCKVNDKEGDVLYASSNPKLTGSSNKLKAKWTKRAELYDK